MMTVEELQARRGKLETMVARNKINATLDRQILLAALDLLAELAEQLAVLNEKIK